jgi:ATP synthase F1 delta subunit
MALVIAVLVRKYAQAFLNVQRNTLSDDDRKAITCLMNMSAADERIAQLLQLPILDKAERKQFVEYLIKQCQVPVLLERLVYMLFWNDRISLLVPVLREIIKVYEARNGIVRGTIATSSPVDEHALRIIQKFIEKKIGKQFAYTHVVDPSLIAGIRIYSTTMLWEYSIDSQLRNSARMLAP